MEALLVWIAQNLSWEALKKALPHGARQDEVMFRAALRDAQARLVELEHDQMMLQRLIEQRNRAIALLQQANRRIMELEAELARVKPRRRKK